MVSFLIVDGWSEFNCCFVGRLCHYFLHLMSFFFNYCNSFAHFRNLSDRLPFCHDKIVRFHFPRSNHLYFFVKEI